MLASKPRPVAVSAKVPWTSSQARTQRPQEMQRSCRKARYGWRVVRGPRRVDRAGPARLADLEPRGDLRPARSAVRRRLGQLREDQLDDRGGDPARASGPRCRSPCPRGRAWCRRGSRLGARPRSPARPTRQTRQAPNGVLALVEAERRHPAAGGSGGLEHRRARRDLDLDPVDRRTRRSSSTVLRAHAQPELLGKVREQAADRRRHAAAVRTEAAELQRLQQRPRSRARSTGSSAANISCARAQADPAREALAAALVGAEAQQVAGDRRACRSGRRRRGSRRGRPCSPRRRAASKSNARVEPRGGQDPAERAADLNRLDRSAVAEPAGELLAELAHRHPERAPRRRPAGRSAR